MEKVGRYEIYITGSCFDYIKRVVYRDRWTWVEYIRYKGEMIEVKSDKLGRYYTKKYFSILDD